MRHLRNFNESKSFDIAKKLDLEYIKSFDIAKKLDLEYIKSCFINMIEEYDGDEDWEIDDDEGLQLTYEIIFYVAGGDDNIDKMIENLEESAEILKEIKSCIKKVQIEYPNVEPEIHVEHEGEGQGGFNSLYLIKVYFGEESIKS